MQITPLGQLTKDAENDWLVSAPVALAALDGQACRFLLEGYENDPAPADFSTAIRHFLALDPSALRAVEDAIYAYYQDYRQLAPELGSQIAQASAVWSHISYGDEVLVCRRAQGDQAVYLLLECECDWAPEEGLQLIFKEGSRVSRVGPFDDFLSNGDYYGLPELDAVVYQSRA